jgi:hypothetical protein
MSHEVSYLVQQGSTPGVVPSEPMQTPAAAMSMPPMGAPPPADLDKATPASGQPAPAQQDYSKMSAEYQEYYRKYYAYYGYEFDEAQGKYVYKGATASASPPAAVGPSSAAAAGAIAHA